MSSSEQSLIYGFLLNALIRTESSNVLRAGRRASSLLRRVMALDEAALREVADLCKEADGWQGWQDSSNQVRAALRRHVARGQTAVKSRDPGRPGDSGTKSAREALRPSWLRDYERRFKEHEQAAAREATAGYSRLERWLRDGTRSLEEFLGLWEPPSDPEDHPGER
jgi:hypothetical protein